MIEVGKVTAKNGLHLRKEPRAHSEILATLPYGAAVDVEGPELSHPNWLRVNYQSKTGYLYKDYVKISQIPPDLDPPYEPPYGLPMGGRILALLVLALVAVWLIALWVT